jgi:hypothetical protein
MLTSHEDERCCCDRHLAAVASLAFVEPSPNGSEDTTIYEYVDDSIDRCVSEYLSIHTSEKS